MVKAKGGLRWRAAGMAGAAALAVGCASFYNGAGEALVSEQDELKLGQEFDQQLRGTPQGQQEYPLFVPKTAGDQAFAAYFQSVAAKLYNAVPAGQRPYGGKPFTYTLIDKDVENAFAVPGGYVYVYTGIIKKLRNESELAGILGHESTHILHHHYRKAMAKNASLSVLLQVATAGQGQLAQAVAQTLLQFSSLKFSRTDEADADNGGVKLAARAGENPMGIATYFQRAKDQMPQWLSDHPGSGNRVKAVTAEVNSDPGLKAQATAANDNTQAFQDALRQLSH